jgi:hypothetical protein
MTFQAMGWALGLRNISPIAKLAAIYIADGYHDEGDRDDDRIQPCRIGDISDFCCVGDDEVRAALTELEEWTGLVHSYRQPGLVDITLPLPIRAAIADAPRAPDKSPCYIYVIAAQTRTKIGISRNPTVRLENLQAWAPETLRQEWTYGGPRNLIRDIEAACHAELAEHRITGEWFDVTADAAVAVVKAQMAKLGLTA